MTGGCYTHDPTKPGPLATIFNGAGETPPAAGAVQVIALGARSCIPGAMTPIGVKIEVQVIALGARSCIRLPTFSSEVRCPVQAIALGAAIVHGFVLDLGANWPDVQAIALGARVTRSGRHP